MLSDHDRRTLAGIDHRLTADDPRLAGYFRLWTVPAERERHRWLVVVTVVVLCLVMLLGVVAGSPLVFWAAALTLGTIVGIRHSRRRRRMGRPASG